MSTRSVNDRVRQPFLRAFAGRTLNLLLLAAPALFSSTLKNNAAAQVFSQLNPIDNLFSSLDNVLVDYQTGIVENERFVLPLLAFAIAMTGLLAYAMKTFERDGVIKND